MMCNKCSKDPCVCGEKKNCCKGGCAMGMIAKILLIIGGLNWGLVGLGGFAGGANWNVVNLIFGGAMPQVEWVIYILVGIVAVMKIFGGCKCKKCMGACAGGTCKVEGGEKMSGNM